MSVTTFAAIDVGSYEVEMVIYEISTHGIRQLDHVRHIIVMILLMNFAKCFMIL